MPWYDDVPMWNEILASMVVNLQTVISAGVRKVCR